MSSVDKLYASGKSEPTAPDDKLVAHIARWRNSDGRPGEKSFSIKKFGSGTYTRAKNWGRDQESARDNDEEVFRTDHTIGDCMRAELATRILRRRTTTLYANVIRTYEHHGNFLDRRVRTIDEATCKRAIRWLVTPKEDGGWGLKPQSAEHHTRLLKAALWYAAKQKWIKWQTVDRMDLQRPSVDDPPRVVPLTVAQMVRIANAVPRHMRAMVLTQAGLGLRIGELQGLRVQDITWPARVVAGVTLLDTPLLRTGPRGSVHIASQIDVVTERRGPLKNSRRKGAAFRDVPLPDELARVLLAHMQDWKPREWEGGHLIFYPLTRGGPLGDGRIDYGRVMPDVAERVGADDPDWPSLRMSKRITSHDLRHHYVSVLAAQGVDVARIAERIGDTKKVVIEIYWHLLPDAEDGPDPVDVAWGTVPDDRATDVGKPWGENRLRSV